MEQIMRCLSIDIGGSSIKRGLFDVVEARAILAHPLEPVGIDSRQFLALRAQVIEIVGEAVGAYGTALTVAISTTGAVDRSGVVLSAGHFIGYEDICWADILRGGYPRLEKVLVVNDGKAATWAEYCGLDVAPEVFAHFVVGTGVGGGLVCFNRLVYGDDETAGALGHMKVALDRDVVCSCGRTGCVETVASGPAIVRQFVEETGVLGEIDFEGVVTAAASGRLEAVRAFEIAGSWLGVAVSNIINVLNPRYITVGGGVMLASAQLAGAAGGPYLNAAIRRAKELAFEDIAEGTRINGGRYGNDGGMIGAALLAGRQQEKW